MIGWILAGGFALGLLLVSQSPRRRVSTAGTLAPIPDQLVEALRMNELDGYNAVGANNVQVGSREYTLYGLESPLGLPSYRLTVDTEDPDTWALWAAPVNDSLVGGLQVASTGAGVSQLLEDWQ